MKNTQSNLTLSLAATSAIGLLLCSTSQAAPTWSTAYDQTSATTNQLRAVEVSDQAGNNSVYTGFIQTSGNRDVKRFDTTSFASLGSRPAAGGDQPKAIATDASGNVFVGNRISGGGSAKITVHNAGLTTASDVSVTSDQFGGLAWQQIGSTNYLYASRETGKEIRRYTYDPSNAAATLAIDGTFGTGGVFTVAAATSGVMRGLTVDTDGTIFVTSRDDGRVYRISADLSTTTSAAVPRAMDVALYDGKALVTSYNGTSSLVRVLDDATLALDSDITITTLDGNPYARGASEGFSGIDIDPTGRIWLGDQSYNISGTTSDRLLVSSPVPEPTTIGVLAIAAVGLLARRRRRA